LNDDPLLNVEFYKHWEGHGDTPLQVKPTQWEVDFIEAMNSTDLPEHWDERMPTSGAQ